VGIANLLQLLQHLRVPSLQAVTGASGGVPPRGEMVIVGPVVDEEVWHRSYIVVGEGDGQADAEDRVVEHPVQMCYSSSSTVATRISQISE